MRTLLSAHTHTHTAVQWGNRLSFVHSRPVGCRSETRSGLLHLTEVRGQLLNVL